MSPRIDERALAELIDLVYESMLEADCVQRFLGQVCAAIGADSAHLVAAPPLNVQGFWAGHAIDPASVLAYDRHFAALSPWRAVYPALSPGSCAVLHGESLCDDEHLLRGEFYNDFLRPNGQRWMRAVYLRPDVPMARSYGLYVYRGPRAQRFEVEVDAVLATLGAHLLRAERLGAAAAAGQGDAATFLVTAHGALLECDDAGERMLAQRLVRSAPAGVSFAWPAADQWLRSALPRTSAGARRGAASRHVEPLSASEDIELALAPAHARPCSPLTRAAGAVLTLRRVVRQVDDAALARVAMARLQWTRAEFDVARRLADGEPPGRIAASRRCALETVRSHVKSAKRKAGVSRQVDLVRLIHRMREESGND